MDKIIYGGIWVLIGYCLIVNAMDKTRARDYFQLTKEKQIDPAVHRAIMFDDFVSRDEYELVKLMLKLRGE